MLKTHVYLMCICLPLVWVMAVGCSSSGSESGLRLGEPIPENATVVRLADVLSAPGDFNEKSIVLRGVVASQCPSLCHFNFQDGVHSVTVHPQGFNLPRLPRGGAVTLYTHIFSGEGQVAFAVRGLRME